MVSAVVFALLGAVVLVVGPATGTGAQNDTSCSGDEFDYVIGTGSPAFGGTANRLYANTNLAGWETSRTYPLDTPIPAGTYDVYAVSYDGYNGRENVVQEQEIWNATLSNAGGALATTANTGDVPDLVLEAYWTGSVGSVTLAAEATTVTATHGFSDNTIPHSVEPICLGFIADEPPPETTTTTEAETTTTAGPETTTTQPTVVSPTTEVPPATTPPPVTAPPTQVQGVQETPTAQPVTAQPDFTG